MKSYYKKFLYLSILLSGIIFCSSLATQAQAVVDAFAKGNQHYIKGKYEEAIVEYLKITKSGSASAGLYYNLGNSYFKINQNAQAILYYEKALKLNPAHDDAAFNLHLARTKSIDKIQPLPEIFFKRWWKNWVALGAFDTWAQLSIVALFLFIASIAIFIRTTTASLKIISFTLTLLFLVSFGICFFSGWYGHYKFKNETFAIVTSPSTYVKSSPDLQGKDLFILHEGAKGKVTEQIGDWFRLQIADGNEGWVKKESVEAI